MQTETESWIAEVAKHLAELSTGSTKDEAHFQLLAVGLSSTHRYRKLDARAAAELYRHDAG